MNKILAIDHGNNKIKTDNFIFTAGLSLSDSKPGFGETIEFGGTYYTLSENRIKNKWDKTEDDLYFVLTLFAMAKELLHTGEYSEYMNFEISLIVGLPPAHYGKLRQRFASYFTNRNIIKFTYVDKPFSITINHVEVYPQAFAAAVLHFSEIENIPKAFVIDIGGYTVDYLVLRNGEPNTDESDSINRGVITLYNNILSSISNNFGIRLVEADIDAIIQNEGSYLGADVANQIKMLISRYVEELFAELMELGIDLRTGKPVFVGGGSIRLKNFICKVIDSSEPLFIEDIKANLKGYKVLFDLVFPAVQGKLRQQEATTFNAEREPENEE